MYTCQYTFINVQIAYVSIRQHTSHLQEAEEKGCQAAAAAAEREEEEEEGALSLLADFGLSLIGVCCSRPPRRCSMRVRMRQCTSACVCCSRPPRR